MINRPRRLIIYIMLVFFPLLTVFAQSSAKKAFDAQKYEEAVEAWNKLLEENPDLKDIHYNQGNANYRLGDLDEAIGSYEKALSLKDKNALADVYYNLGNAYLNKQEVEKARDFYKQALRIRPGDQDAKANLELLNHMPPPPHQDQNSQDGEDDKKKQDKQDKQDQQDSDSQDENEEKQEEQQQDQEDSEGDEEDQQDQQQSQDEQDQGEQEQQEQQPSDGEELVNKEELMNAQQLLDALKDRETENMREQIRLKTSGKDNEKDW